jgi:hypothetical protein
MLNLSCRTGKQRLAYAGSVAKTAKVYGFDAAEEARAHIRSSDRSDRAQIVLYNGRMKDVATVPVDLKEYFDWIMWSYGPYSSKDPQRTGRDLKKRLKSGGRFAVGPARKNDGNSYTLKRSIAKIPDSDLLLLGIHGRHPDSAAVSCRFASLLLSEFDNQRIYSDTKAVIAYWNSSGTYDDKSASPESHRPLTKHLAYNIESCLPTQALGAVWSEREVVPERADK